MLILSKNCCNLFERSTKSIDPKMFNCGECKFIDLNPPASWSRVCSKHDELVKWSKENINSWKLES